MIGSEAGIRPILKYVPFSQLFRDAAEKHDKVYKKGGGKHERDLGDVDFLIDTTKVCGYNPLAYIFAYAYYIGVRWFGWMFFNWRVENAE